MTNQLKTSFKNSPEKTDRYFILAMLVLSAALQILSFAPYHIWPLGFVSFIPLFFLIDKYKLSFKRAIRWGIVLALAFYTFISYWLYSTIIIYGHFPEWLGYLTFAGYCIINSSRFILFFVFIYLTSRTKEESESVVNRLLKNRYIVWPVLWSVSELIGWELFPVAGANLVSGDDLFIQAADIVGIHGLSLIWFLVNLSLYDIAKRFLPALKPAKSLKPAFAILVLFSLLHVYGYLAKSYWNEKQTHFKTANFAVIQGNAPLAFSEIRNVDTFRYNVLKNITEQTIVLLNEERSKNRKVDFVVWPESGIPLLSFTEHTKLQQVVYTIQNEFNTDFILNDIDPVRNASGRTEYFNNMWLIPTDQTNITKYHKIILLPFGEYIPLSYTFPALSNLVPEVSNFTPGDKKALFNSKIGGILPSVCYELMISRFTLDFFEKTNKKARVIVNLTNDTWFGKSAENFQHLELARIRAIELRLPIVRSTNSGISAYIDITGTVLNQTPQNSRAERIYKVSIPERSNSLFSIWGYLPLYIYLIIIVLLQLFGFVQTWLKTRASET
ncbi:MAG: apolipoprotein N-acyltransferase [Leptospirales bacterium]